MYGTSYVMLQQVHSSGFEVRVNNGFFPSLDSTPLKCVYEQCELLSGIECSTYLSGYFNCIRCEVSSCTLGMNDYLSIADDYTPYFAYSAMLNPFVYVYQGDDDYHPTAVSVFGCKEDGSCVWIHDETHSQHLQCSTGVCRPKKPAEQ